MTQHIVTNNIAASMEAMGNIAEHITTDILHIGSNIAESLATGHVLYCLGNTLTSPLCEYFCQMMLTQLTMERPALPCVNLTTFLPGKSTLFAETTSERELSALCKPGDILLIAFDSITLSSLLDIIECARNRKLTVITIAQLDQSCHRALSSNDFVLPLTSEGAAENHQLLLFYLQNLHDTIEQQLFSGGGHREE